jgi:hypothetical protein
MISLDLIGFLDYVILFNKIKCRLFMSFYISNVIDKISVMYKQIGLGDIPSKSVLVEIISELAEKTIDAQFPQACSELKQIIEIYHPEDQELFRRINETNDARDLALALMSRPPYCHLDLEPTEKDLDIDGLLQAASMAVKDKSFLFVPIRNPEFSEVESIALKDERKLKKITPHSQASIIQVCTKLEMILNAIIEESGLNLELVKSLDECIEIFPFDLLVSETARSELASLHLRFILSLLKNYSEMQISNSLDNEKTKYFIKKIEDHFYLSAPDLTTNLSYYFSSLRSAKRELKSKYEELKFRLSCLYEDLKDAEEESARPLSIFLSNLIFHFISTIETESRSEVRSINKIRDRYIFQSMDLEKFNLLLSDFMNAFPISEKKEMASKKRSLELAFQEDKGFEEKVAEAAAKRIELDEISSDLDLRPFLLENVFNHFEMLYDAFSKGDLAKPYDILLNLYKIEKARDRIGLKNEKIKASDFYALQILNMKHILGQSVDQVEIRASKSLMICLHLADHLISNGDEEQLIFNYLRILSHIERIKNKEYQKASFSNSLLLVMLEELNLEEALDLTLCIKKESEEKSLYGLSQKQIEEDYLIKSFYALIAAQINLLKTSGRLTMRNPAVCRPFLLELKTNQKHLIESLAKIAFYYEERGEKTYLVSTFCSILSEIGMVRKKLLEISLA